MNSISADKFLELSWDYVWVFSGFCAQFVDDKAQVENQLRGFYTVVSAALSLILRNESGEDDLHNAELFVEIFGAAARSRLSGNDSMENRSQLNLSGVYGTIDLTAGIFRELLKNLSSAVESYLDGLTSLEQEGHLPASIIPEIKHVTMHKLFGMIAFSRNVLFAMCSANDDVDTALEEIELNLLVIFGGALDKTDDPERIAIWNHIN